MYAELFCKCLCPSWFQTFFRGQMQSFSLSQQTSYADRYFTATCFKKEKRARVTVGTWNCCLLAHSITALSKHRRPRDLFHTFVTLFKISWMQQLLLFCCVALKRSWYKRCCTDTNDCIGRCKSVNCPVVGGDLEEWKGEDINLRELCPHLHFPLFFFSTAGPSLLRNLGGSCSLFSSLQINTPLFSEFF